MMRYLIPTLVASVPILLASTVFADPCSDAICSLAGHAGSSLGTGGILGLLVAGAVVLGVWFYRRRDRVDGGAAPARTRNAKA
jgi:uncharacterized membrane protein